MPHLHMNLTKTRKLFKKVMQVEGVGSGTGT